MPDGTEAKARLDSIIAKTRTDMYKPIQIAEVLHRSRIHGDVDCEDLGNFKNPSLKWRNAVTNALLGKESTSSAQYQHNVWADNAMTPQLLALLDQENRESGGLVEKYIYERFAQKQITVGNILDYVRGTDSVSFDLEELLYLFEAQPGLRRSIDKAYEIVTYCVVETVVEGLGAQVEVTTRPESRAILELFEDLAGMVLMVSPAEPIHVEQARVYRAGRTNAADRGLDMWCNFGPAIQVKHLTLDPTLAGEIVNQVDADRVVLVCRSADKLTIELVLRQIGWGSKVSGIITEKELRSLYSRCLSGPFAEQLSPRLMDLLESEFVAEFPQGDAVVEFMKGRGYHLMVADGSVWDARCPTDD